MRRNHKIVFIATLACLLVACLLFASCDLHLKHEYGDNWFSDETYHWKQCSVCDNVANKQKHDISDWLITEQPTETTEGLRLGKCSVCNKVVKDPIPMLEHQHSFSGEYRFDGLGHWQVCGCGEKGSFAEHVVTSWTVTTEATENSQGIKHGVCDVCNADVEKVIPVVGHTHSYSDALEYDDNYHYYECDCGDKIEITLHAYSTEWKHDSYNHWHECVCGSTADEQSHNKQWIVVTPATTTSEGLKKEECTVCKREFGTQTIDKLTSSTRTVDFYAINDFHGEVERMSTVGGYLKERKNSNANTVLINSGDMFQGSMGSNSNYGKLLTDCMDAVGFNAFAFGNHEFDWGLEKLESLAKNSNVPFLGANIYHWNASSKTWGTFASELAQKYTTVTLDNGLKVGIIGVIGSKQITSISSNLVQTIGFKDPMPIIKELATELRGEQACDVVVVTAHTSPRGLVGEPEGNDYPEEPSSAYELEKYVDAVFCAHTHQEQNFVVDGLRFIQGGSYGSYVSHISLNVNSNGQVSCSTHENIRYSNAWPNLLTVDTLIDNSNAQIEEERNQELAYLDSSLNSNPQLPRLVCHAIADYAVSKGYDITLAMTNNARSSLSYGRLTYSKLYEAIPFDNVVYIAKVSGSDLLNEAGYSSNSIWRVKGEAINYNDYYYIAVIDYLLYHQNDQRNYNYFPSAFRSGFTPVPLTHDDYDIFNYRFITREFLLNNANTLSTSLYCNSNNNNDKTLLQSVVDLEASAPSFGVKHEGTIDDPYDIADVLIVGADYTSGYDSPSVYVECTVSNVAYIKQSESSGDLGNFYVTDENGATIKVYYVSKTSSSSNNWTGTSDIKVGDVLLMCISPYVYNGTPQLGYGYCVSVNGIATA